MALGITIQTRLDVPHQIRSAVSAISVGVEVTSTLHIQASCISVILLMMSVVCQDTHLLQS